MIRRLAISFACALAVNCGWPHAARAGPADVSRVLKSITFEERRLGNREDLPMNWIKLQGPGLPSYVNGKLSDDRARTGEFSFKLELNGGSLVYRYDPLEIPVRPGSHYEVESFVQTTVLPHAKARMTAYFTDIDGHTLASSIVHSDLYAARADTGDWHKFVIDLTASDPKAAFLSIELELLQPSVYAPTGLGERALFDQDIRGAAWFDDITVSQVPQVILNTARPGNIFRRDDPLQVEVQVNDRFTDDLAAQLVIRDATGAAVFQRSGALDMATAKTLGSQSKQAQLDLPDLKAGWYDAELVMTSRGQFVGKQDLYLVRLADDGTSRPDPRFGVIATDLPFEGWPQLPGILPLLSVGRVKLAVWNDAGDIVQADPAAFDSLLAQLESLHITPTACLTALPPSIARQVGGSSWAQLDKASPDLWQSELAFLVARHANHLDRWQFGADRDASLFVELPQMRRVYDQVYKEFVGLVEKPDLAMPWPAWYDLSGNLPATIALSVPPEVLPAQLPLYLQDIRSHAARNLSVSLQVLDDRYGREEQIRDLAQRVTYALAAGADRIDLPLPFMLRKEGDQLIDEPLELFMVIRTLITQLAGAKFMGKVPIASNVEAFLFDRDGQGVLILWNRGGQASNKQLALNLGDHPMRVDLWGNVTPLLQTAGASAGSVSLQIGPMPIFLVDIDGVAAQMRASVGFDQPLLESSFQPHARRIHFANPGQTTIGGAIKLTGPAGWTLSPSVFSFSLNPGETFDRAVTIEFPYNSFAGLKTVQADFEIQAERNTSFSVPISLSLGLSDVGMQTIALRDKNDLVVQQMISNYGNAPIDYTAFTIYPGQSRQERLVTRLGPGRTTIKLYRFSNFKFIPNAKVRSGLRQIEGTRILNDEVTVQ
ncbi:MAG: NEW3 domain-containing protein [Planctomycetota bacterium]|nr:NEW3 domain-containing protein [Planctomycetota bacterium]